MNAISLLDSSVGAKVSQVVPKASAYAVQPKEAGGQSSSTRSAALDLIYSALSTSATGHDLDVLA